MTITFTVPGQPVGKGRPRASRTATGIRMRTPEKTVRYENLIALAASAAMIEAGVASPITGPVRLHAVMCMQIPASWSKKAKERAAMFVVRPTTKPDADNVLKAIGDACNGICWRDDSQIVDISLSKRYSNTPALHVTIAELTP